MSITREGVPRGAPNPKHSPKPPLGKKSREINHVQLWFGLYCPGENPLSTGRKKKRENETPSDMYGTQTKAPIEKEGFLRGGGPRGEPGKTRPKIEKKKGPKRKRAPIVSLDEGFEVGPEPPGVNAFAVSGFSGGGGPERAKTSGKKKDQRAGGTNRGVGSRKRA